jgi:hypothetical protein
LYGIFEGLNHKMGNILGNSFLKTYQQFTNSFSTTAMVVFLHFSDGNLQFFVQKLPKTQLSLCQKVAW